MGKVGKAAGVAGAAIAVGLGFAARAGFKEMQEGERVTAQTNAVLASTGGIANVTGQEIDRLAASLLRKSGVDDEQIKSGANMLLTFTKIRNEVGAGNDVFNQATKVTLDLSVAMGKDMQSSAILVGKALNDPIKGVGALSRAGVQLDSDQKALIKTMVAAGDTMGAQKIILKELETQFGGSAAAAGKTLAGQMNVARESFSNLTGQLMTATMPAFSALIGVVSRATSWMSEHQTATKVLVGGLAALAVVLGTVSVATSVVSAAIGVARAATAVWTAGQWLLNAALTANPIGVVIVAIAALGAGIVIAYQKSETFRNAVDLVWAALKRMGGWIQENWGTIAGIIGKAPIVVALRAIAGAVDDVIAGFKTLIGWVRDAIGWLEKLSKVPGIGRLVGDARDPGFNPFIGSAGAVVGASGGINLMGANPEMMPFAVAAQGLGLQVTSGLRPGAITANGTLSDHARGKALDFAGSPFAMGAFFDSLIGNRAVKQAFYDPKGSIFGGLWNSYREGGHSDHVHVATYDKGGWLAPRSKTLAINNTPYWEPVGPPRAGRGDVHIHLNGDVYGDIPRSVAKRFYDALRQIDREQTGGRILSSAPTLT